MEALPEIWFYHLEQAKLEQVLPPLLEKALAHGWRSLVCVRGEAQMQALDRHLWVCKPDSFIPHGSASEPRAERQPVLLTTSADNENEAQMVVVLNGGDVTGWRGVKRVVAMFSGQDEQALARARDGWKAAKKAGHEVSYWRQNEQGKWARQ